MESKRGQRWQLFWRIAEIAITLAVIVAVPGPTPVTGTFTLAEFAARATLAGTVTAAVLLEISETVNPPAGAGADRFK